jgi:uncharacterized protein YbjT (DUF2867 family)
MTSASHAALILGGSGRTGSLVARHLAGHGIPARTASRHSSGVFFDWDDPAAYPDALTGTDRVYLVTPVLRVRYAARVAEFLDQAEAAGTRHVTLLSTYNGDRAPREIDIAAVAAETLLNPDAHAGARYALTGPQALIFDDVAASIAAVSGRPVRYKDIDQEAWISGAIAAGAPADYAVMLRWLTGAIIGGDGSQPTGDVETVTGRPPASFEAFARRNAAAWTTPEDK